MADKIEKKELTPFERLFSLDVNDKTEKKSNGKVELTYLSWSWAWAEFKKVYPDAQYEIKKFPNEKGFMVPYMEDPDFGLMVWTSVTAGNQTYEMWLPVMDGANNSMKRTTYSYKTKYGENFVKSATMFDINKNIMRCLVKNLAMFGLGLYIYSGEDLPEDLSKVEPKEEKKTEKKPVEKVAEKPVEKPVEKKVEKKATPVQIDFNLKQKDEQTKLFTARCLYKELVQKTDIDPNDEIVNRINVMVDSLDRVKDELIINSLCDELKKRFKK